ncbi:carboxypeptidase-like regulatory domain-containing protein [Desertivirga brevis]|uniref:carboxypeptidase-like regulatory domain-containing protein n=1 Tax=Desertivirga brevis TaxID=2810310 RepID=UPI001A96F7FB|nr:carboxypeptidase-like regulatory domain-containing protein [Pedobacter sp. SYSU D00873]
MSYDSNICVNRGSTRTRVSVIILFNLLQFICLAVTVKAQQADTVNLRQMVAKVNRFAEEQAAEKLYLHTDKASYNSGDTLWFKAYVFNGAYLSSTSKSGIMYVEVANDSNRVVKRLMLPVYLGLSVGQLALEENELPQGWYTLRAYTNWMRNFNESAVYSKPFYISTIATKSWIVNLRTSMLEGTPKDRLEVQLKIDHLDKVPVGLRELQLSVINRDKTITRRKVQTDVDGQVALAFDLGTKTDGKALAVNIEDLRKGEGNRKIKIPLTVKKTTDIDLQFLPEGGKLVAGVTSKVAFKALSEEGLGIAVRGKIYDSRSRELAVFEASARGMGAFRITPEAGETYWARIEKPEGLSQKFLLPAVEAKGVTLSVSNPFQNDSCTVVVSASQDLIGASQRYYLMGEARGILCYASSFILNKPRATFQIDKKNFPSGIVRFTLAGSDKVVLSQRLLFADHHDDLALSMETSKTVYKQRDSVSLKVKAQDKTGAPVVGSFSLSVTDDGLSRPESGKSSIISHLLLTSDLKGYIEDPGYYFEGKKDPEKWKNLDLLLLTHGWASFDWTKAFQPTTLSKYPAEPEFTVKGRITNLVNKPVQGANVLLVSKKPFIYKDTMTNTSGNFTFRGINPGDSAAYFIQVKNKKGKNSAAEIEVETFVPPVFASSGPVRMPWFVNVDTIVMERARRQVQFQANVLRTGKNVLREVVVTAKKVVRDSKNLNGPGEADVIIGEKDLENQGRTTLLQLLEKNVKGFGVRTTKTGDRYFAINGNFLHLIIDGVNTEFFYSGAEPIYEFFKQYFDYYDASEIKGIEVMNSGGYQMRYSSAFLDPMVNPFTQSFLEITTRGGVGPFLKKTTGTFLYKPIAFTLPKKFYSPKYPPNSVSDMTDYRHTVYWAPNIITNQQGEAEISFYTSDNPGRYSIIIEGSDMNGKIGTGRSSITIEK